MSGIFTEDIEEDDLVTVGGLAKEIARLKSALDFYANEKHYFDDDIASDGTVYKFTSIEEDNGRLARETLTQCAKK